MNKRHYVLFPVLALSFVLALVSAEVTGWTFLATPLQSSLQQKMGRMVSLNVTTDITREKDHDTVPFALHLWGGIRLQSANLEVGAPTWSKAPYLLSAQGLDVHFRYADVWRAWQGQQLVVQALAARQLTVYLERRADGRASWQETSQGLAPPPPRVQSLDVQRGNLHYTDAPLALQMLVELSLSSPESTDAFVGDPTKRVLRATAQGHYRQEAFRGTLQSTGSLPWEVEAGEGVPVAVKLAASLGRANLNFEGTAKDLVHLNGVEGAFRVQGPSLAALAKPLGVSMPTTPAFNATGHVQRHGALWTLLLRRAQVGNSQLSGRFVLDKARSPPQLSGTLKGARVKLVDLAPALGVLPINTNNKKPALSVKVLPTRPFDLVALRAMDADVHIHIEQLDTLSAQLEPLRPFAAHLTLTEGVLTLSDIDARTAQGRLAGRLSLNGQRPIAHWSAALRWDGVQLQRWIHQQRAPGLPPYVTGQFQGRAALQGQGRSTADILASLSGNISASVVQGTLSHLLIEMGGLDLAESLGVFVRGDKVLVLDCALADVGVKAGSLRPRLLVLDTRDSTIWVDGTVSLANEQIDLRAVVAPKDFSVLSLRSPLHLQGSLAHPKVSVEKGPVGLKLGLALLLGMLNPIAAVLPLVDLGDAQEAENQAAQCQKRLQQKLHSLQPVIRQTGKP